MERTLPSLRRQRIWRYAAYILFALFYFWLAAQIPYTDDDWDWGLPVGIQQLVTASLNSRYVGNAIVVLLTRSTVLKTLVMGAAFFLLPLGLSGIFSRHLPPEEESRRTFLFLICNVLLLSMERIIWKQTYSWVSGFSNYVVPMVLLAVYMQEAVDLLDHRKEKASPLRCALLLVMCVVMQLFIENLAIFMVLLGLYLCLVSWKQSKKIQGKYLCMVLGSLIGLAIMFSSPIYSSLFGGGDAVGGYREIIVGGKNSLVTSLYRFGRQLAIYLIPRTWGDNIAITIVLLALVSWRMLQSFGRRKKVLGCVALNGVLAVYFATTHLPVFPNTIPAIFFRALVNLVYFATFTLQLILLYRENKKKLHKLLLIWLCIPGVILPLTVVSECSHRLFLAPVVFSVVLAVFLLEDALANGKPCAVKGIAALVLAAALVVLGHYGIVYASIGSTNVRQLALVEEDKAKQADTITLPAFRYEDYLWYSISNVAADYRYDFFKEYYGIDPDVSIVIAPVGE